MKAAPAARVRKCTRWRRRRPRHRGPTSAALPTDLRVRSR